MEKHPKENPPVNNEKTTRLQEEGKRKLYESFAKKEEGQYQKERDGREADRKLKLAENLNSYEKALQIIEKTGRSPKEAQSIFDDPTNPYIEALFQLIESMPQDGYEFVAVDKKGNPIFEKNKTRMTLEIFNRALAWQKSIYPSIKAEILTKGITWNLVEEVLTLGGLPQTEKFIENPSLQSQSTKAVNELRYVAKWRKQYTLNQIRDFLTKNSQLVEENPVSDTAIEAVKKNLDLVLPKNLPEAKYLEERVLRLKDPKPMDDEELAEFISDIETNVLDSVIKKMPGDPDELGQMNNRLKSDYQGFASMVAKKVGLGASEEEMQVLGGNYTEIYQAQFADVSLPREYKEGLEAIVSAIGFRYGVDLD